MFEYFSEGGADADEFRLVCGGEFFQDAPTARGKADEDLAAVVRILRLGNEAIRFHAVHQADGTVVLDFQMRGEFADGETIIPGGAVNDQHGLVLLGRDACSRGGLLTEVEELAEGVPKGGKMLVVGF